MDIYFAPNENLSLNSEVTIKLVSGENIVFSACSTNWMHDSRTAPSSSIRPRRREELRVAASTLLSF